MVSTPVAHDTVAGTQRVSSCSRPILRRVTGEAICPARSREKKPKKLRVKDFQKDRRLERAMEIETPQV